MNTKFNLTAKKIDLIFPILCNIYIFLMLTIYLLSPSPYVLTQEIKYTNFLTINIIFILIFILIKLESLFFLKKEIAKLSVKDVFKNPNIYFVLYLLSTCISAVFSKYDDAFYGFSRNEGFFTIGIYITTYILINVFSKPTKFLLYTLAWCTSIFCIFGIIQLLGYNPLLLYPESYNFYDSNVYYAGEYWSTIGNSNFCISFLSVSIGIFVITLIRKEDFKDNLFYTPLVLGIFSVFELNVEAGIVAILAGLLLAPIIAIYDTKTLINAMQTYAIIFITIGFSIIITFYDGGFTINYKNIFAFIVIISVFIIFTSCKITNLQIKNIKTKLASLILICTATMLFIIYFSGSLPDGFLTQAQSIMHGDIDDSFGSGRIYIWREVIKKYRNTFGLEVALIR